MKKMQLKGLSVESFTTTAKVKGGQFPYTTTITHYGSCLNDRTCEDWCR